jgi:hypothetical protein
VGLTRFYYVVEAKHFQRAHLIDLEHAWDVSRAEDSGRTILFKATGSRSFATMNDLDLAWAPPCDINAQLACIVHVSLLLDLALLILILGFIATL